eukprot:CCRYP_020041-RC/>CCRYP_020041-RC protein AED:0.49 eAED:0.49 QI:0/-1/0/1/-1/0/1/0/10
MDMRFHWLRC